MQAYEVPSEKWVSFFDLFSSEHVGWPITIEVLDQSAGPQQVARDLPLQGFNIDPSGSRPCSVHVGAGDQPDAHVSHALDLPLHIRLSKNDDGSAGTIQLEPARGPITLVHFHAPAA